MLSFSYIILLTVFLYDVIKTLEPTDQSAPDSTRICPPCVCYLRNQCLIADCFNRNLTSIPNTLPMSTCVLNLSMNAISRVNSHGFEYLLNLTVLDLSKNAIDDLTDGPFRSLQNLQYLNLTGNNMTYLNEDTFANLTSVLELNVSNCQLSEIHPESLSFLKKLQTLDLSGNQELEFDGLENATFGLQESNITKLFINRIVKRHKLCVKVTTQNLKYLQNTSLETIEANGNQIESFQHETLSILPDTLKYVSVRNNRFAYANYLTAIPKLKGLIEIDFGRHTTSLHDLIPFMPIATMVDDEDACYKSKECDLDNRYPELYAEIPFEDIKTSSCNVSVLLVPPNLKRVRCKYAEYSFAIPEINFGENNLEYIDLSYNLIVTWKGPVCGLKNLQYLDLSENLASYVSNEFFSDLQSLTFLNISANSLGRFLSKDYYGKVFRNLYNVKTLDISRHYAQIFPRNIFQGLKSLITLNISHNELYILKLNLTQNTNLTLLNCSHNQITWIDPRQRHQFDLLAESHNFSLDLGGNPLHCHCKELVFWKWVATTKVNIVNIDFSVCQHELNITTNITNTAEAVQSLTEVCAKFDNSGLFLGVLSLSFLITMPILGSLGYRYRWKLRYWYYAAKMRMKASPQPSDHDNFEFDAFVSYADEDRGIVLGSLMPKVEAEGLHLNIHHRDFIPGNAIAENIIDAIQRSRKTIIILSKNFLKSKWCQYELHMANMESVSTGREILLIMMLEDIPTKLIPPEILYHIQNNTYIDYPNPDDENSIFWNHLCQSLIH